MAHGQVKPVGRCPSDQDSAPEGIKALRSDLISIRSITGSVNVDQRPLRFGRSSTKVRRRPLLFVLVGVSRWCQKTAGVLAHA